MDVERRSQESKRKAQLVRYRHTHTNSNHVTCIYLVLYKTPNDFTTETNPRKKYTQSGIEINMINSVLINNHSFEVLPPLPVLQVCDSSGHRGYCAAGRRGHLQHPDTQGVPLPSCPEQQRPSAPGRVLLRLLQVSKHADPII